MNSMEKLAYLKGLIEGLALDETKKDTKVINNLVTLLEDIVLSVTTLEENFEEMQQQLDAVDEDLGEIEKDLYEDVLACSNIANVYFIRQKETKGLGHAIMCAKSFVACICKADSCPAGCSRIALHNFVKI